MFGIARRMDSNVAGGRMPFFTQPLGQGAQNSLPWALALILGVFAKVLKTPPPNFAHLDEAWSAEQGSDAQNLPY